MAVNQNPSILVVDDHSHMRASIQNILYSLGYTKVETAQNGRDAIALLAAHDIECIISDWNMPELNGYELLQHVRGNKRFASMPFMLVTGEVSRDKVSRAIAAGVSDFIVKPFTPAMLKDKIPRILANPLPARTQVRSNADADGDSQSASKKADSKAARGVVLVVDDTPNNIDLVAGVLRDHYQVRAATNGPKALKQVRTGSPPDLILLDIMMPDMDGLEVCRQIKADPNVEHIPIIFLTAKSEVSDMAEGFAVGAVDYVTKPIQPEILLARVNAHIRLKSARDSLSEEIETMMENARLREDIERMTKHDLKNPLSSIIGTADTMLGGNTVYLGVEQKEQVESMREAAYEMLGMINRSMDLYRMEQGTYELNGVAIDLVQVTQRAVSETRAYAHKRQITVLFDSPDTAWVLGEDLLLFSMLSNLLRNAVEASPAKGTVQVTVKDADDIQVSVHNMGVIPMDIREGFFEKYVTSGKKQGTGLGTYSARLMASVHGGKISFTSTETEGTTITVSLPIRPKRA